MTISEVLALRFIRPSGVDAISRVSVSEILSGRTSVISFDLLVDGAGDLTIDLSPLPGGGTSFIYVEGGGVTPGDGVQIKIGGDSNTPRVFHTLYEFAPGNQVGTLVINTGIPNTRVRVIVAN